MNQYQQKGILVLVGIAMLLVSLALTSEIEVTIFRGFGLISFVLSGLLWGFDSVLWKCGLFYDWLVPIPNLNGTWSANGAERIARVDTNGDLTLVPSSLTASTVTIDQQFSAIHLSITWTDRSTTRLKEPVPVSVSGRRTKVLTFGGVYDYTPVGGSAQPRNVSVSATMESRFFRNKPQKITLAFATGDRQGMLELTRV